MGPGILGSVLVGLPVVFAAGTVIVFLPTCCGRFSVLRNFLVNGVLG